MPRDYRLPIRQAPMTPYLHRNCGRTLIPRRITALLCPNRRSGRGSLTQTKSPPGNPARFSGADAHIATPALGLSRLVWAEGLQRRVDEPIVDHIANFDALIVDELLGAIEGKILIQ